MSEVVSTKELKRFNKVLADYLTYNKREQGPLIENRANRLRWNIYRSFKAIAPTPQQLEDEAVSRGYQIKRGLTPKGKRRTFTQELAARKRSLRFLSVSWLYRGWKNTRDGQQTSLRSVSRSKKNIGQVVLNTSKGKSNPSVRLESFLKGVRVQNQQRGIVERNLKDEMNDMRKYIRRKQLERWRKLVQKN
jgi:hypothetical protein